MTNLNDSRILELKKQIAAKKEKLGRIKRFNPMTNCSIEIDGVRYNLNTLNSKSQLITLLVRLNMHLISAKELGVVADYIVSGYSIPEWITDVKSKLDVLVQKDEEKSLQTMEVKLSKLLSEGKKVELEIDEIESLLKE